MAGQYTLAAVRNEIPELKGPDRGTYTPDRISPFRGGWGSLLGTARNRQADARSLPRLWHHDYLHLRSIARDLRARIGEAAAARDLDRVLDVGSGGAPYRNSLPAGAHYVRLDLDPRTSPDVVARGERLPFGAATFDAVLSSQLLGLVDDPERMGREIARVLRPGGVAWVSGPAAYPYDGARTEHRFGAPELARLFPGLRVREIVAQGGMLALPFVLANVAVREAVRAGERRLGALARPLRLPAVACYVATNVAGGSLEWFAARRPLSAFLGYLDRRLPMNFLVVAEKAR